jgi:MFS transporter, DHA2 family, multidrug resistance protein
MQPTTHSPAGRKEWLGFAVLALPTLLVSMDMTILYLATPSLSAALQPSGAELLWISDIYGFVIAGALIPMGAIGDRIGRRRLLLIGSVFFGLASILAAFSTSATMLIAARAILGVGGATLLPSTLAMIRPAGFQAGAGVRLGRGILRPDVHRYFLCVDQPAPRCSAPRNP